MQVGTRAGNHQRRTQQTLAASSGAQVPPVRACSGCSCCLLLRLFVTNLFIMDSLIVHHTRRAPVSRSYPQCHKADVPLAAPCH